MGRDGGAQLDARFCWLPPPPPSPEASELISCRRRRAGAIAVVVGVVLEVVQRVCGRWWPWRQGGGRAGGGAIERQMRCRKLTKKTKPKV